MGQTFVIVTHDEGLAKITDRTVHMVDGTIKKINKETKLLKMDTKSLEDCVSSIF